MLSGVFCPEELTPTAGICAPCQSLMSINFPLPGAQHFPLSLVAMLSHPALFQASISVYIAVYFVYVFIPGQVCSCAALA